MNHALDLTPDRLRKLIETADGPVIVDFWEPRCSACRATLDAVDQIACRVGERAMVGTINVRDYTDFAKEVGITTVPTMLVFRDGRAEAVLDGAEQIQAFEARIGEEVLDDVVDDCRKSVAR